MRTSLNLKINLIILGVVLVLGSALGTVFVVTQRAALEEELERRVQLAGVCIAATLGDSVDRRDAERMNRALQVAVLDREISYAMVKSPEGEVLAARWAAETRGGLREDSFPLYAAAGAALGGQGPFGPVASRERGPVIGQLAVGVDLSHLRAAVARLMRRSAAAILAAVALSLLVGTTFVRLLLGGSLKPLLAGIRAIGSGDLSQSIVPDRHAEIREIGTAFNDMARRLSSTLVSKEQLEAEVKRRTAELATALDERIQAQTDLADREARIRLLLDSTAEAIYGLDERGVFTFCNPACLTMLGYGRPEDLVGRAAHPLIHHSRADGSPLPEEECVVGRSLRSGEGVHGPHDVLWRADGSPLHVECWSHPIFRAGVPSGVVVTFVDISERLRLEAQLLQAQKLEAIGILAGGIAHDFNNLLTPILGYTEMAQRMTEEGHPSRKHQAAVLDAATRAAELTQQILAFSRKQLLQKKVLDLNDVIIGAVKMVGRLIGEDIEVRLRLAPALPHVDADPAQIQQVLFNLAVNARDAMPRGGVLTFETAVAEVEGGSPWAARGLVPGPHVLLGVSDTGCGMDEETLRHAFEPFYTTKEVGKGTGLGLSTVHGIVKQHGGDVSVYSEPGRGTTFRVYLPCASGPAAAAAGPPPPAAPARGRGTILLVEDEQVVREFVETVLAENGYRVRSVSRPAEALEVAAGGAFDLVISDVIMPGMNGRELCRRLAGLLPGTRFLFISGYPSGSAALADLFDEGEVLLQKPFTVQKLLETVRERLGLPA